MFSVLCVSFGLIVVVHVIWLDFFFFFSGDRDWGTIIIVFDDSDPSVWSHRNWRKSLIVDFCAILGSFFLIFFSSGTSQIGKIGELS